MHEILSSSVLGNATLLRSDYIPLNLYHFQIVSVNFSVKKNEEC